MSRSFHKIFLGLTMSAFAVLSVAAQTQTQVAPPPLAVPPGAATSVTTTAPVANPAPFSAAAPVASTTTTTTTTTAAQPVVVAPRLPQRTIAAQPAMNNAAPAAPQIPLNNIQPVDNQAIMNGLADASSMSLDDAAQQKSSRNAYNAAINGLFPMSTEQIEELIEKLHSNERAIVGPAVGNPKAEVKVETISLEPGAQPKEIQTDVGFCYDHLHSGCDG